jgi:hypothetical protein
MIQRQPVVTSGRVLLTPEKLRLLMPKLRRMRIIKRGHEHLVRIDPQGGLTILREAF